jgi:hypothetical protein
LFLDYLASYGGVLLLLNQLQNADRVETKLTLGRILQASLHNRLSTAYRAFARYPGWQLSLCCLFTKEERREFALPVRISVGDDAAAATGSSSMSPSILVNSSLSFDVENDPDLMSFELIDSGSGMRGGRDMAAAAWQMLPQQLNEIRGMAETVGSVVSENIHVRSTFYF